MISDALLVRSCLE